LSRRTKPGKPDWCPSSSNCSNANRKFWLIRCWWALLVLGALLILGGTAAAPFIYTLF